MTVWCVCFKYFKLLHILHILVLFCLVRPSDLVDVPMFLPCYFFLFPLFVVSLPNKTQPNLVTRWEVSRISKCMSIVLGLHPHTNLEPQNCLLLDSFFDNFSQVYDVVVNVFRMKPNIENQKMMLVNSKRSLAFSPNFTNCSLQTVKIEPSFLSTLCKFAVFTMQAAHVGRMSMKRLKICFRMAGLRWQ